jgi:putative membrane protein
MVPLGLPRVTWNLEPWLLALLAASAALYVRGSMRLWARAGHGRGITTGQASRFAAGWLVLVAALVSPLDAAGERSFALHMVQHELLMVIAAPLLVTARPLEAWTWALPREWRRRVRAFTHSRGFGRAWALITEPVAAWSLHALALWAWHVPAFFEAALAHEGLHVLQHASFLASALLFWWSVLGRRARAAEGVALASLFTPMLHTGVLGALLTLAPSPWYPHYIAQPRTGFTPLEDQQLGGLVMWMPAGLAYAVCALALVSTWLRDATRSPRLR